MMHDDHSAEAYEADSPDTLGLSSLIVSRGHIVGILRHEVHHYRSRKGVNEPGGEFPEHPLHHLLFTVKVVIAQLEAEIFLISGEPHADVLLEDEIDDHCYISAVEIIEHVEDIPEDR